MQEEVCTEVPPFGIFLGIEKLSDSEIELWLEYGKEEVGCHCGYNLYTSFRDRREHDG